MTGSPPRSHQIDVELVTTRAGVGALGPEWDALPTPVAAPCPTTDRAFVEAWLDTLGRGHEPHLVAVRRSGRLLGVVPLSFRAGRRRDGGRQISLAGSRRPPMTDMADVRVVPGEEIVLAEAMVGALEGAAGGWDTLYLGNVAAESRTFAAAMGLMEGRGWTVATRARSAMVMETAGGWDDFRRGLGRTVRTMPRKLRGLERIGAVRFEPGLTGEPGRAALEEMMALYRRRWGAGNWLEDPAYRELLRRLRTAHDPHGARVAGLWVDDHPLAFQLIFRQGDRDQSLLVAADRSPEWSRQSPGMLLDYLLAERAFADDTTEVHLLHTVLPSKLVWTTRFVPELTVIAVSPRARRPAALSVPLVEAAIAGRRMLRRG
ncbi:MAG: GNAT family N-acetyltransferase [Thermoleophilia bacterium]|nr:GNAT family N-acetyltransferase [Thermoleophilia bacterium]